MTPFDVVYDLLAFDGVVRWFAKRHDGVRLGGAARTPEELAALRLTSLRGADVYVQLNPAAGFRGMRAGTDDITHFRGFLLDMDPVPGQHIVGATGLDTLHLAVQQASDILERPLVPWVIDSGRGLQAWVLNNPISPTAAWPGWREQIQRSVSNLVKMIDMPSWAVLDPMVCDVARVARLPGTFNQKTKREAAFVLYGQPTNDLIDGVISLDPGPGPVVEWATAPESVDSYHDVWTRLTGTAQTFIQRGWGYPGRHTALWHTAGVLRREGLSKEAVYRALSGTSEDPRGARLCRPSLSEADVRYAISRAWEKKILDGGSSRI